MARVLLFVVACAAAASAAAQGIYRCVHGRDTMSGFSEQAFEALVARSR